jgi:pimeloyl-ACP methyl ester carboxylesterase
VPIASIDAGSGPPLVLLHGIGSNAKSWRRQVEELSKDFRVVAWDAPGYGRSSDAPTVHPSLRFYAEALGKLLADLKLNSVNLLGHSMGGIIAQEFYRTFPGSVSKLILADTTTGGGSRARLDERLRMIRTMSPSELAAERAPKLLSRHAAAEIVQEAVAVMAEVRPAGYEFAAIAMAEADTSGVLRNLKVPTLLIWGEEDEITPLWKNIPPEAALEVLPNAGHLCYMEQPGAFNAAVRRFLKSGSGANSGTVSN